MEPNKYPLKPVDANGEALVLGDWILFKMAPDSLISELPLEAQTAIKAQEGKLMEIVGFDEYGHAEMQFTSIEGTMHTIWVAPKELFKKDNKN